MKKKNMRRFTSILILLIILFSVYILSNHKIPETPEEVAKCIGENSILYVQLGCHACEAQEELFGNNSIYLNTIDCWFEREKCEGITHTPTWKINGELYIGKKSINELKNMTECY